MGMFDPPKPANIPMPPPAAHPSTLGSASVGAAGADTAKAAKAADGKGMDGTVATSSAGVLDKPDTARATLLGQ